jgi:hypothetical protein
MVMVVVIVNVVIIIIMTNPFTPFDDTLKSYGILTNFVHVTYIFKFSYGASRCDEDTRIDNNRQSQLFLYIRQFAATYFDLT